MHAGQGVHARKAGLDVSSTLGKDCSESWWKSSPWCKGIAVQANGRHLQDFHTYTVNSGRKPVRQHAAALSLVPESN